MAPLLSNEFTHTLSGNSAGCTLVTVQQRFSLYDSAIYQTELVHKNSYLRNIVEAQDMVWEGRPRVNISTNCNTLVQSICDTSKHIIHLVWHTPLPKPNRLWAITWANSFGIVHTGNTIFSQFNIASLLRWVLRLLLRWECNSCNMRAFKGMIGIDNISQGQNPSKVLQLDITAYTVKNLQIWTQSQQSLVCITCNGWCYPMYQLCLLSWMHQLGCLPL